MLDKETLRPMGDLFGWTPCFEFLSCLDTVVGWQERHKKLKPHSQRFFPGTVGGRKPRGERLIQVYLESGGGEVEELMVAVHVFLFLTVF